MSDKIRPQHLERKAILYIRQSSAYQVTHNLESQKLQYAMQERLRQLGWREIETNRLRMGDCDDAKIYRSCAACDRLRNCTTFRSASIMSQAGA